MHYTNFGGDVDSRSLLDLESFGKKSFLELMGKLRPYMQDVTADRKPIPPLLARALENFADSPACSEIFGQDPRFRETLAPLIMIANSNGSPLAPHERVAGILRRVASCAVSNEEESHAWIALRSVQGAIKAAMQLPLETELYSLLRSVLDDRSVQIACRLYGFDGRGGATLQETGDEFHLTRERVRASVARSASPLFRLVVRPGCTSGQGGTGWAMRSLVAVTRPRFDGENLSSPPHFRGRTKGVPSAWCRIRHRTENKMTEFGREGIKSVVLDFRRGVPLSPCASSTWVGVQSSGGPRI